MVHAIYGEGVSSADSVWCNDHRSHNNRDNIALIADHTKNSRIAISADHKV